MIFCAEIGSMHKGVPALAFEMIRQAKLAGADIAKFQLGHPYSDRVRFIDSWAQDLKNWCEYFGIEFMASIFSMKGLEVAREINQKRYKFPSKVAFEHHSKLSYYHFFEELLKDDKEIFVTDFHVPINNNVRKLWAIAQYPTYPEDIIIPEEFGNVWYGYSSHVHGIEDALIAIARGAQYVEKHVTLDKTEESIKDNHFALSFDEFAEMVRIGRGMERLLNG